jgi:hypothetical protein
MDWMTQAKQMAEVALRHPNTVGSRLVFTSLASLLHGPTEADAEEALLAIDAEARRLRANGYEHVRLPHPSVELLQGLLAERFGIADRIHGVVDGTWRHEGIREGEVFRIGLAAKDDHARRERDGAGVRMTRCRVERLGADAAGVHPYVWFQDIDRPGEGVAMLSLERFRACMGAASPGVAPAAVDTAVAALGRRS